MARVSSCKHPCLLSDAKLLCADPRLFVEFPTSSKNNSLPPQMSSSVIPWALPLPHTHILRARLSSHPFSKPLASFTNQHTCFPTPPTLQFLLISKQLGNITCLERRTEHARSVDPTVPIIHPIPVTINERPNKCAKPRTSRPYNLPPKAILHPRKQPMQNIKHRQPVLHKYALIDNRDITINQLEQSNI